MAIVIQFPSGERRMFIQESLSIGCGPACSICLPDASELREEHARLKKIGDRWIVESGGEWFVRVGPAAPARFGWLKVGDVIRLSEMGPDLIFEPAQDDVVLEGPAPLASAKPARAALGPDPTRAMVPPPPPMQAPTAVAVAPAPGPLPCPPLTGQAEPIRPTRPSGPDHADAVSSPSAAAGRDAPAAAHHLIGDGGE